MPEAPELACSRDQLKPLVEGETILDSSPGISGRYVSNHPIGFDLFSSRIKNSSPRIIEVATHGKFMWWKFAFSNGGSCYLHNTYGMSGGWFKSPTKHTAFIFEHSGGKIYFNDPRHFGTLKFVFDDAQHQKKLASLGPCILSLGLTPEIFAKNILKKPTRTIAEALMDQKTVSGIGNYIKSEALLRAGISPWRNVTEITSKEYVNLCQSVLDVATESYKSQGASIKTYRNVDDSKGTTQFNFKIYSKKMCPSGHPVINETTTDGRTSWWCKDCQK